MARFSKRSLEGEFLIDHRASPGTSEVPGGDLYESAIIVCQHCAANVVLNPKRERPRGYCAKCDGYICDNPLCSRECTPIVQAFDVMRNHLEQSGQLPEQSVLRRLMPSVFSGR